MAWHDDSDDDDDADADDDDDVGSVCRRANVE